MMTHRYVTRLLVVVLMLGFIAITYPTSAYAGDKAKCGEQCKCTDCKCEDQSACATAASCGDKDGKSCGSSEGKGTCDKGKKSGCQKPATSTTSRVYEGSWSHGSMSSNIG